MIWYNAVPIGPNKCHCSQVSQTLRWTWNSCLVPFHRSTCPGPRIWIPSGASGGHGETGIYADYIMGACSTFYEDGKPWNPTSHELLQPLRQTAQRNVLLQHARSCTIPIVIPNVHAEREMNITGVVFVPWVICSSISQEPAIATNVLGDPISIKLKGTEVMAYGWKNGSTWQWLQGRNQPCLWDKIMVA